MENQAGNIPDEATGNKITWGNTTPLNFTVTRRRDRSVPVLL